MKKTFAFISPVIELPYEGYRTGLFYGAQFWNTSKTSLTATFDGKRSSYLT
jgi:hypothetical protein